MQLNLTAGLYLLEVARSASIRRAADRLHVAPSAISRQIFKLEQDLQTPLIERRNDGVALTEAGDLLVAELADIFGRIENLRSELLFFNGAKRGNVSISTVEGITRTFLSDRIAEFRDDHPEVVFNVRIRGRDNVLEDLERRVSQIGFVYDHFTHPSLDAVGSWHQPLLAFAPPGHELARKRNITLREIGRSHYLLPDETFGISQLVRRAFKRENIDFHPLLTSNQLQFLTTHAIRVNAVIFAPLQALRLEVLRDEIVPLDLVCHDFNHRHIFVVTRRDLPLRSAATAFKTSAIGAFKEMETADADLLARVQARL